MSFVLGIKAHGEGFFGGNTSNGSVLLGLGVPIKVGLYWDGRPDQIMGIEEALQRGLDLNDIWYIDQLDFQQAVTDLLWEQYQINTGCQNPDAVYPEKVLGFALVTIYDDGQIMIQDGTWFSDTYTSRGHVFGF